MKPLRPAVVLLGAAVLLASTAPLRAAEPPRVGSIAIQNRGPVPVQKDQVLAYLSEDYVGRPLDPVQVSRDIRALLKTKFYSYAGTAAEPQPDGSVKLVFIVEGRYRLDSPVDVAGQDFFSRARIRKFSDLKAGDAIDSAILEAAAARIRAEYVSRRFYDAQVKPVLLPLPDSPGSAAARFEIDEGRRMRVPLIRFEGNDAIPDRLLRRHTQQAPWWDPYTCFFKNKNLSSFDLEHVRNDARAQYADLGYLDAAVSPPDIAETNGVRRIRYTVVEGPRYRIGDISLQGARLFPEATLLRTAGIRPGDIASQSAMDAASKAVRDYYGARGYIDTTVRLSITPDPEKEGVVNLRFAIREGALLHIRSIHIQGNTVTKDKVIRREIPLDPGDIYNDVAAERGDRRLENLGYFSTVRHNDLETDDPAFLDVVYEVEEKSTGQLLVGAGFSSVDHLIGFAEISQNNFDLFNWGHFTGGGQKARLGVQASGDYTDAEISFTEPWFLDRYVSRLALNVDAFLRNHSYHEYDERRYGGSVGVSRHIPWVGRVGLSLTAEKVELDDVIEGDFLDLDDPSRHYRYTDENDDYFLGSLKLSWLYDTRDRPMVPTRGTRATASASYYGEALGSDVEMFSLNALWRLYIPVIYSHVLSFSLRADTIDTFDSDDTVPIGSRYFLGGGRNVRGFRNRAIGPKVVPADPETDSARYRPIGGQTRIQGSVEYSIPIFKALRFGAFYDIGNVWSDAFEADFSEYASSYGAGLRLDFPGFPIRFDYAIPVEKDDDLSRTQRFIFWVGFD